MWETHQIVCDAYCDTNLKHTPKRSVNATQSPHACTCILVHHFSTPTKQLWLVAVWVYIPWQACSCLSITAEIVSRVLKGLAGEVHRNFSGWSDGEGKGYSPLLSLWDLSSQSKVLPKTKRIASLLEQEEHHMCSVRGEECLKHMRHQPILDLHLQDVPISKQKDSKYRPVYKTVGKTKKQHLLHCRGFSFIRRLQTICLVFQLVRKIHFPRCCYWVIYKPSFYKPSFCITNAFQWNSCRRTCHWIAPSNSNSEQEH